MATYCDDGVLGSIDFSSAVLVDSDDAIARLDRQLALTEEKLENGLEELIVAINSLSVDNDYKNVKDAVDSLIKTSSLEECACLQPEPQDVVAFLQTLASIINKSSSTDNFDCLLDLLQVCCKHGFVLPYQAPPAGDKACSTISINTISSSSELEIEELWSSIRLQLKKQLLKKLADPLLYCPDMKLILLQALVFLYPADEAWKIYKSHRGQEINQALADGLHLEDAKPEDVLKIIKDRFRQVQQTLKDMMVTDFKIMSSRVFQDVSIYNALKSLYSSKISHYLVVNLSQPSKMTPDLENMSNNSSTITIEESDILAVSVLTSDLMEFESAMEDVLHQLNWTSEARSKRTSKHQPKGVLKVSREARMSKLGISTDSTLPAGTVPPLFSAVATMVAPSANQDTKCLQKLEHWWKDILSGFEEQLVTMIPLLVQQSLSNHDTAFRTTPHTGILVCEQQYGWSSCPRYVSKHYGSFFTLVQQLTPIACVSNTLQDVFVTSVRSAINDILLYVYKVKSAEASSIAMDCVQALSMATYCAAVLLQLHQALHEGKENSCFVSLRQQFLEVIDELADKLVSYHVTTLCNILLHDADSHNYTDQRAFYEDERCSFSVQMYHLHLESVKHDWSMWLPGHLMQKMMMAVVERSLSKLAHRYSLVKPSYKRMRQMRVDITALLFIIYNNMLTFCDSVSDVMGQAEFHSSCQCLLRVVTVVTSPLDVLCKAFHRSLQHEKHQVFSMIPSWLQCMAPSVFPFDVVEFSNLPDKSAVHIIVSVLSRQPCVNLSLTLQALTMRESVLAKILCEQPDELNEQSSCVGLGCSRTKCLCSLMKYEKSILMPIARLLATCNEQPHCLANVLVPIIEKGGGCGNLPGKREDVPPWLLYIKQLFAPQIERLIKSCVKDLVEFQREGTKKKNTMSNLTHLPCGCPLARERKLKLKDEEHILNSAAQTLVSRLSQVILCFSLPLCLVFQRLQEKVDQEENCKKAVALEVLCWCVWNTLRTEPFDTSDKSALVTLKRASEMTMEVLSMEADETDYSSHPLSSDWLKELIAMTTSHCTQDHLANFNIHPVEEGPLIFQEKYYMGMAIDMATNKQGVKDLILINKLIKRNAEWIEDQLEIPALIPHKGKPSFHSQITLEPMTPPAFNPLEQFNKLGRGGFDHEALGEYAWDWPGMLKINLGLTPVTFRHLFSNRFEMLEGEPLNDHEKKYVAILKERYELDVELV